MKLFLLAVLLAALTGYACGGLRRKSVVVVDLEGIADVQLREDLRLDTKEQTSDQNTFHFRRIYDTHINGQTSYAEFLTLSLLAEDLPVTETMEVRETVYEQHPVTQPAWRIQMTDPKAGVSIEWQGFRKHYTAEEAKAYLRGICASVRWKKDRAAHFQSQRDWPTDRWPSVYAKNLELLNAALAEEQLPAVTPGTWTKHGPFRYIIDNQRPQHFHLVRAIADLELPDGPFRLLTPLTYFRYFFTQHYWHQENQGNGGGKLPEPLLAAFRTELVNQNHVYFYRIQSLQMWKEYPSVKNSLQEMLSEAERRDEEFRKIGAIDASAEP